MALEKMNKLILTIIPEWKSYGPKKDVIKDEKLGVFWLFLTQIPPKKPEFIIDEIKERTGGINIIEFNYKNSNVIISNELDDPKTGTYISIEENQLYEIIEKYAELARKKTPTIILIRDGENYEVKKG